MQTSDAYHTQGIRGFQVVNTKYIGGEVIVELSPKADRDSTCPACKSRNITLRKDGDRLIIGLPSGKKQLTFTVPVYRVSCNDCASHCREELPFCPKWARYTNAVARLVIDLRREMCIKAVAAFIGLDWRTV